MDLFMGSLRFILFFFFCDLFFFVYPFYYFLFLDKKKKLNNKFAFNNNGPRIDHIAWKKKSQKEKNKTKRKELINKSTKIPKYFKEFSNIKMGFIQPDIKIKEK